MNLEKSNHYRKQLANDTTFDEFKASPLTWILSFIIAAAVWGGLLFLLCLA